VAFWVSVWEALRLRERYSPLAGLDGYQIGRALNGEVLRPLIDAEGDVRVHVGNGAISSFTGTLPLLHPFGRIQCHDLFLTGTGQYRNGFYGPGKYDGSVVSSACPSRRSASGRDRALPPLRRRPGTDGYPADHGRGVVVGA
jgi:hypothetical protein